MTFCFLHRFWFEWLVEDNDGHVLAAIRHGLGLRWNWLSDYWFRMNACHLLQRFVHKVPRGLAFPGFCFHSASPPLNWELSNTWVGWDTMKIKRMKSGLNFVSISWRNTYIQILTIDFVQIHYGCNCDPKIDFAIARKGNIQNAFCLLCLAPFTKRAIRKQFHLIWIELKSLTSELGHYTLINIRER